jgi:hypothetical protein
MSWASTIIVEMINLYTILMGNIKGRGLLEDGMDGRIILK